jgi:hypothetical protein
MIFQTLDDILPKGDIKIQGTHENKCSIMLNNLPIIRIFLVDLTLIVELITMRVMNSTFQRLN